MAAESSSRKLRKPYSSVAAAKDGHESLLDALLLFGNDWKRSEVGGAGKASTQKCNNVKKFLPKVHKNGFIAHSSAPRSEHRQAKYYPQKASDIGLANNYNRSASWIGSSNRSLRTSKALSSGNTTSKPGSPLLNFYYQYVRYILMMADLAEAYNFIGNIFDPDSKCPSEVHMQKLKEMDPVTAETVLVLMRNLTTNISTPDFEPLRMCLSTYDAETQTVTHQSRCSCHGDA